jgi:hypothetical protein
MASVSRSRLFYFVEQGMDFKVTVILRTTTVERWIRHVQREFLDDASENSKCISLGYEYTDTMKNVKQRRSLPSEKK